MLEYLDELSPRTLFATHYHELTTLVGDNAGQLRNVSCLTIDVREHNNDIVFMHKIVAGVANRSYGIHVAKMAGMPASVVARAESVLAGLEGARATTENITPVPAAATTPAPKKPSRVMQPNDTTQLTLFG